MNIDKDVDCITNKLAPWRVSNKNIPTVYAGKSFQDVDSEDVAEFLQLNNVEKFEMAYWIERGTSKESVKIGFFLGMVVTTAILVPILITFR